MDTLPIRLALPLPATCAQATPVCVSQDKQRSKPGTLQQSKLFIRQGFSSFPRCHGGKTHSKEFCGQRVAVSNGAQRAM